MLAVTRGDRDRHSVRWACRYFRRDRGLGQGRSRVDPTRILARAAMQQLLREAQAAVVLKDSAGAADPGTLLAPRNGIVAIMSADLADKGDPHLCLEAHRSSSHGQGCLWTVLHSKRLYG